MNDDPNTDKADDSQGQQHNGDGQCTERALWRVLLTILLWTALAFVGLVLLVAGACFVAFS
jgi:hypothetical protein